ncbi:MAG: glycosyltransferase family 39 protein [Candidatus Promineifilaceae bacterium]|nr:glycosyltransferase family 39 protein [Candidatus Promineifilaceae bacterium]
MNRHVSLGLMVVCLLIAVALRVPGLVEIPPGPHFDEAANGVLAAEIGLQDQRPIFITSYTGKEVLFFYLAGGLMRLLGDSLFTLRLTAALLGVLTVAVTYRLGVVILRDRRVALLAAALLAISFWHVLFSRLGFRAISQPLLQAATVLALFYGLRHASRRALLAGGVLLGLTAYTYLAARLFPLPLGLALVPVLLARPQVVRREYWSQLALVGLMGLVVLVPLLIFFIVHPETFSVRISQVLPGDASPLAYLRSYGRSLGMLFLLGDPYWRFNIPQRPIFDWFWGGMFLIGWFYGLVRWRQLGDALLRAALLLLVFVPLIMLLPTALALGEIVPSNLRAIGLLPFIYYPAAMGLVVTVQVSQQALQRRLFSDATGTAIRSRRLARAMRIDLVRLVIVLVLTAGAANSAVTYFNQWASRADLFYESDADLAAVARYLDEASPSADAIYVAAAHYRHPTVAFLADSYERVKWLPESAALTLPADGSALYLYPRNSPAPDWVTPLLGTDPQVVGPTGPDGDPTFVAYRLNRAAAAAADAAVGIDHRLDANFSNIVTLLGYDLGSGQSGATLPLTLYWRIEAVPPAAYQPFVHLEDAWRYRWSQIEPFAYPAEQWQPGETVVQRIEVPLPEGMPPDQYRLRVGLFDPQTGSQLAKLDEAGRYAGNAQIIDGALVSVGPPPAPPPEAPTMLYQRAGNSLTLLGYERAETSAPAGGTVWLSLWWYANDSLQPMTTRLELVRADNTGIILANSQPVHGTYPFVNWDAPQFVIDHQRPTIPAGTAPGDYTLSIRLLDQEDETVMAVDLGPLTVTADERRFTPPRTQFPLAAVFGNEIRLLGYDKEPVDAGQVELTLVWQAISRPAADYTVFVHLLDQQGVCCLWQADRQPQEGSYPTSGWLPDEVVVDNYTITLPPDLPSGQYPLEIGLFVAESGQRLRVEMPGLRPADALFLRPVVVE